MNTVPRLFSFLFVVVLLGAGQTPHQIKIIPIGPESSAKPEPETGDKVEIDPRSGDLIVQSRGLKRTFQRGTRVLPEFSAAVENTVGAIKYVYFLRNAPSAQQFVSLFMIDVGGVTGITNAQAPPYWFASTPTDPSGKIVRIAWGRRARDDDNTSKLSPGTTAGPFSFVAETLPGLIQARVQGFVSIQSLSEADEAKLSPWVRNAVNDSLKWDSNTVGSYTVGPKIPLTTASVFDAVRGELAAAAKLAAFADIKLTLSALSNSADRSYVRRSLSQLSGLQKPGFKKDFLDAMAFDLDAQP